MLYRPRCNTLAKHLQSIHKAFTKPMQSTTRLAQAIHNVKHTRALRTILQHLRPILLSTNPCQCIAAHLFTYDPDADWAYHAPLLTTQHHVDLLCALVGEWADAQHWTADVQQQVAHTVEALCKYEAAMATCGVHVPSKQPRKTIAPQGGCLPSTRAEALARGLYVLRVIRNQ